MRSDSATSVPHGPWSMGSVDAVEHRLLMPPLAVEFGRLPNHEQLTELAFLVFLLNKERHIFWANPALTFCSHCPCPAALRLSQEIAG